MPKAPELPRDPFALAERRALEIAARRQLRLFGAPVELLWLPQRGARPGVPQGDRPPFRRGFVDRILRDEAVWSAGDFVLTPNRYPFADRHLLLWTTRRVREPFPELLEVAFNACDSAVGTVLMNATGAAASIPRAHVHLVGIEGGFLGSMPGEALALDWLDGASDLDVFRLAEPYPSLIVGLRGPADARARAVSHLIATRLCPAFNLVAGKGLAWVFPRSAVETPVPHFPHALGAAEVWGRWCFEDEASYRAATPTDLERALIACGYPPASGDGAIPDSADSG